MKFIKIETITPTKAKVMMIHYMPLDPIEGLSSAELATGFLINDIPDPEENGMSGELFYNPETKSFWYEYTNRPKTTEEKLAEAETKINLMQAALDELILGGM